MLIRYALRGRMKNVVAALVAVASVGGVCMASPRTEQRLRHWQFSRDSINWQSVNVPHDWAIYGPFDRKYDLQTVAVTQNGETEETLKTGRTGGLPYEGKGYYTTTFELADTAGRSAALLFDGAMSHARVRVNGREVAYWPYGYNSFYAELKGVARPGTNVVEVSLENKPKSSRWYPGAGLYRNVHLIDRSDVHVPVWGTQLTTPYAGRDYATVNLRTDVAGLTKGQEYTLCTRITNAAGQEVAADTHLFRYYPGEVAAQNFIVREPALWTPETPTLYRATTEVVHDGRVVDTYTTRFGIRSVEVRPGEGFFLNGEKRKFRGVCNHHDLGPLGAAINTSALRHQLQLLKDMGADAVRTSHNMPAPELAELCDEMGLMLMVEPFDDWGFHPKSENGYGSLFKEWAERDISNMVRNFRNHPSVVMWSIGNEVPSQWGPDGIAEVQLLQNAIRRDDPTRPITCGMDQFDAVVNNGFAAAVEVPGFNYKVNRYGEAIGKLPQNILLGTETASTVSSRGKYYFPVEKGAMITRPGNQSSSYDTEYCSWSNLPDDDFAVDDDLDYNMGQFVWTGFDYLGEPTPFDTDAWPSHSSVFGIIDLASLPKDRYYLYRSKWNTDSTTLHILPHWNWPGREGEVTPIFVYTSAPRAELFINGRSQGVREKNDSTRLNRYRLMWNETRYEPGEVRVVAYNADGSVAAEKSVRTPGKAYALRLSANTPHLNADGDDLAYITVSVVDKEGNPVPTDERPVRFRVQGAGTFRAAANGDPTSLRLFHLPETDLFSGAATAIVQASQQPGTLVVETSAKGLRPARIEIPVVSQETNISQNNK